MTGGEVVESDVLRELRLKGNSRRDRWHTPDTEPWTGADWSNAMCGEAGEAANVVKKLRRIETGTASPDGPSEIELLQALSYELADTIAYADLLAQHYDIDLRSAIAEKFNIVSEREGFPERIHVVPEMSGRAAAAIADLVVGDVELRTGPRPDASDVPYLLGQLQRSVDAAKAARSTQAGDA